MAIFFVILYIGGFLLLFLVLRTIVLWYWKIDKITNLLERIANALEKEAKQ